MKNIILIFLYWPIETMVDSRDCIKFGLLIFK